MAASGCTGRCAPVGVTGLALRSGYAGITSGSMSVRKWQCVVCGFVYDEAEGWPEDGIEPGTRWEDVPEDWVCPDCGVGKEDFEMIEID